MHCYRNCTNIRIFHLLAVCPKLVYHFLLFELLLIPTVSFFYLYNFLNFPTVQQGGQVILTCIHYNYIFSPHPFFSCNLSIQTKFSMLIPIVSHDGHRNFELIILGMQVTIFLQIKKINVSLLPITSIDKSIFSFLH